MKLTEVVGLIRKTQGVEPGCDFDFASAKLHKKVEQIAVKLAAKYGPAKLCGRNRVTYESKHVVIKLPKNEYGIADNQHEASHYQKSPEKERLARARLLEIDGIPVIVMIKVDTLRSLEGAKQKPDWAGFFDCGQVGLTAACKWRAYDYGYH